eukprot:6185538-Pleurochrysis_carterae.AAC.2
MKKPSIARLGDTCIHKRNRICSGYDNYVAANYRDLGVVRAVTVVALVHIRDVGDVLEGCRRAGVGMHWQ